MTELPVLHCALDADGLAAQIERYRILAAHVVASARDEGELTVDFAATVDRGLLERTLEVERGCCSFFNIARAGDRVHIGVTAPEQRPALDAIAYSLGVGGDSVAR